MSVSLWAYDPVACDNQPCVGDCDFCDHLQDHETDFYDEEGIDMSECDNDIKQCPFCGYNGQIWTKTEEEHSIDGIGITSRFVTFQVRCEYCAAGTDWYVNKDDAIKAWNRRMAP